ncbi:MAG: glycosyl transferase [Rickettsiales bacterium]|nr:glycosyl transferase [Rickettsiales bacterium]|tara:strand:+ start:6977 stop:7804 length:828 start_codon:yes stop_codon:yes gene_type:complete
MSNIYNSRNNIAVIMSVYKNDNLVYLKESLESLFNQTYSNFDILIQQDGKLSDGVEEYLIDLYKEKKVFYFGQRAFNKGLAYSLNELLNLFLGQYDYFFRMDADDICHKNRVKSQLTFMEHNIDVDVCGSHIKEFYDNFISEKKKRFPLDHKECLKRFYKSVPIAHPSAFFRKTFFAKAGLYSIVKINQDSLLWMSGFKNNCIFANVDDFLLSMRVDNDFILRRNNKQFRGIKLHNRLKIIQELKLPYYTYIYAFLTYFLLGLPVFILKFLYKIR